MIYQNCIKVICETPPVYLVSEYRHDFQAYYFNKEEYIAVDGNCSYLRRVGDFKYEGTKWIEWSLDDKSSPKELREKLLWKTSSPSHSDKPHYLPLCECSMIYLKFILKDRPEIKNSIYEKVIKSILKTKKA